MKIERQYTNYQNMIAAQNQLSKPQTSNDEAVRKGTDVSLSSTTQQIQQASQAGQEANSEKVAAIKTALAKGTYHVSPEKIAAKMWTAMKESTE